MSSILIQSEAWVQKTANVCGGDACIRETRHTMWGLIELQQLGQSDERILEHYPDLTQTDLDAAWGYYRQYKNEFAHV
jgi:uncharacterized protein (DUF433 family)